MHANLRLAPLTALDAYGASIADVPKPQISHGLPRSATASLELGARGEEFLLALAQMRDAVEHLKRVDLLEAVPMRAPRNELIAAVFIVVIAALIGTSPNPRLLRARASKPRITIAREQAQRVQRLADSIQPTSLELDALRQLVSKGARTIDARSNEPDTALNALQDLEEQVRQMSAGDDQLSAALAVIAGGLASDPVTKQLANAINTGDRHEISQAANDLAAAASSLSGQDQQRCGCPSCCATRRVGRAAYRRARLAISQMPPTQCRQRRALTRRTLRRLTQATQISRAGSRRAAPPPERTIVLAGLVLRGREPTSPFRPRVDPATSD